MKHAYNFSSLADKTKKILNQLPDLIGLIKLNWMCYPSSLAFCDSSVISINYTV